MNKLRTLCWGGGGLVVVVAIWAAMYYGTPLGFSRAIAIGVVAAGLPFGLTSLKSSIQSLRWRLADPNEGFSAEQGSVFVSESVVEEGFDCLEIVRSALEADEDYDEVRRDAFEEGPGLTVLHAGFHNSFVRITETGRVVITGASEQTHELADAVSEVYSLSFERTRNNPFKGVEPIKGAPRVFLGVVVFTILLFGFHAVAVGAYPSGAYNPAERTVLVGIDAQASLDPGVSETEARLTKAAFLTAIVDEASTEVRWEVNDTDSIATQGEQALQVSSDARSVLATVDDSSPTPRQAERADRIERRLSEDERSVAAALDERADDGTLNDTATLSRLSDRLRASANSSIDHRSDAHRFSYTPVAQSRCP